MCVPISVTWTAEPGYLAERDTNSHSEMPRELTVTNLGPVSRAAHFCGLRAPYEKVFRERRSRPRHQSLPGLRARPPAGNRAGAGSPFWAPRVPRRPGANPRHDPGGGPRRTRQRRRRAGGSAAGEWAGSAAGARRVLPGGGIAGGSRERDKRRGRRRRRPRPVRGWSAAEHH